VKNNQQANTNSVPKFILASSSPRRRDLLAQIGINLTPEQIIPADINENAKTGELPRDLATRLAKEKAHAIEHKNAYILAADTVVACGRRILPKAENIDQARECLNLLSGRRHHVYGGICLITPDGKMHSRLCDTSVKFKCLSAQEIERYLGSEEWGGKAGGYAIQGLAAGFIPFIQGSYSNIVGLSLHDVTQLLTGTGFFK
jgi:septum formation protein